MKPSIFKPFFFLISLVLILSSCDKRNFIYKENIKIPENIWDMNNIAQFKPEIDSINCPYNIYLNVRHADFYPGQNLWLFIHTTTPSGILQVDTFECILADDNGKWFGDGAGDIWDLEIPYKQNIAFPEKGEYKVEIQHGMRIEKLPLIMEIGISIEMIDLEAEKKD